MKLAKYAAILTLFACNVSASDEPYRLLMAGGGLATCTSVATKNCTESMVNSEKLQHFRRALNFSLSQTAVESATDETIWPAHREQRRQDWILLLNEMRQNYPNKTFSKSQFRHLLSDSGLKHEGRHITGEELYRSSSDAELYRILDHLEVAQFAADGQRLKEQVWLNKNKNPYATEIYQAFVAMSRAAAGARDDSTKPHILVVTASARDPFEAADFYTSVFEQAGAARVTWLPLDAAYQAAQWQIRQGQPGCEQLDMFRGKLHGNHNRAAIYPELAEKQQRMCEKPDALRELIASADGIFLNGGDQSLTVKAFRFSDGSDTPELALIRKRFAAGTLAVGGTSAGTAVLSGRESTTDNAGPVMITNGSSRTALARGAFEGWAPPAYCSQDDTCGDGRKEDDLTFRPEGGLKLFPWGIADTHFSERARHPRLALLAASTGSRFGFGVDEATALLVTPGQDSAEMKVVGQGGVVILDTQYSELNNWKAGHRLKQVGMHFLTRGDAASLSKGGELSIRFAGWKRPVQPASVQLGTPDKLLEGATLRDLSQLLCLSVTNDVTGLAGWSPDYRVTLARGAQGQQVYGVAKVSGHTDEQASVWKSCSFAGWQLSFRPDQ